MQSLGKLELFEPSDNLIYLKFIRFGPGVIMVKQHKYSIKKIHTQLKANENLPDVTNLWAALKNIRGGTCSHCIYDPDKIIEAINAGISALSIR